MQTARYLLRPRQCLSTRPHDLRDARDLRLHFLGCLRVGECISLLCDESHPTWAKDELDWIIEDKVTGCPASRRKWCALALKQELDRIAMLRSASGNYSASENHIRRAAAQVDRSSEEWAKGRSRNIDRDLYGQLEKIINGFEEAHPPPINGHQNGKKLTKQRKEDYSIERDFKAHVVKFQMPREKGSHGSTHEASLELVLDQQVNMEKLLNGEGKVFDREADKDEVTWVHVPCNNMKAS